MLYAGDFFPVLTFVGPRNLVLDELLARAEVQDRGLRRRRFPARKLHAPSRIRKNRERKPPANVTVPPQAKLLVSREEAAQLLSISVRGVDYLIATKRLFTRRSGTRVLIPIEDVRKFAGSDHPDRLAG